jgi:DNA-binding CsgD family transcriptional regulator
VGTAIDDAHAAFERGEWGQAHRLLSALADDAALPMDDLDRLASAAYLMGREQEAFDSWARGHRDCLAVGDIVWAARFAVRLAQGLGFKGDIARAGGWVGRGRRLLDEVNIDCVESGYLEHAAALCRIFDDGDVRAARDLFARAYKIGERFRDRELLTMAGIGKGRCLIYLGEIAEGIALLDEAMVAVEAREISPLAVGDAYCTVIDGCHELFDVRRCETWTTSFTRWCESQPDLVLYRGHCLLHRAEIMQLHGAWPDAIAAAKHACARLAEPISLLTIGGAHYVEGELYRLRGEHVEAERSYEEANRHGCEPQPGLALLRLAQGRVEVAEASIRRVLAQTDGVLARAPVLGPYVEIVLAAGDIESARPAAEELAATAAALASPLLHAHADHATGAVLLAGGDPHGALRALRGACTRWGELDAPYEAARTRMLIAATCDSLGDHDGADLERRAARGTFEELGALIDLVRLEGPADTDHRDAPAGLTAREIEVLILVARGETNRAIAEQLFISEKTVASHLNHVFTKVGLPSRAAATAYAYEHHLV